MLSLEYGIISPQHPSSSNDTKKEGIDSHGENTPYPLPSYHGLSPPALASPGHFQLQKLQPLTLPLLG